MTRRGVETAVLLPIAQWREMQKAEKPSLKEALLAPESRTDVLTPPRRQPLFMNAASCTSSSVTPPALWVARVTSTRL